MGFFQNLIPDDFKFTRQPGESVTSAAERYNNTYAANSALQKRGFASFAIAAIVAAALFYLGLEVPIVLALIAGLIVLGSLTVSKLAEMEATGQRDLPDDLQLLWLEWRGVILFSLFAAVLAFGGTLSLNQYNDRSAEFAETDELISAPPDDNLEPPVGSGAPIVVEDLPVISEQPQALDPNVPSIEAPSTSGGVITAPSAAVGTLDVASRQVLAGVSDLTPDGFFAEEGASVEYAIATATDDQVTGVISLFAAEGASAIEVPVTLDRSSTGEWITS